MFAGLAFLPVMRNRLPLTAPGFVLCVCVSACTGSTAVAPTSTPTPVPTPTLPPLPGAQVWSISGTVWNYTSQGRVAASAGAVFGWVELADGSGRTTGRVDIAADGQYAFNVYSTTKRVRIGRGANGYQPCAVTLEPTGSVSADVNIVTDPGQLGANIPPALAAQAPTMSGVVYEETLQGRRPVPNAWVELDGFDGLGVLIADTLTDNEGRYVLCNVPYLPHLYLFVGADGFQLFEYWKDLIGRTNLDIELRRR